MSGIRPTGMGGPMGRGYRIDRSAVDQRVSRRTLRRVAGFASPHRGLLAGFLTVTVLDAAIVIVNPLLIRHIIDEGILKQDGSVVTWFALAMVATALVDASFTVVSGWLSSRIGEGLIYDLRTRVFAHVQRMSLAFFTRTQTGALVSRLNNDVMGAQRAFTSVLSSVVSNSISVLVVGIAMFALSWQVTLLCLAMFPFLFLASRWVGNRLAGLTRQQMNGNAALGTVMTERFNVGGALLLSLFGRHADEDRTYSERADTVRDLGVRISVIGRVFTAALLLVPAIATAMVYGVGGELVISGALSLGTLTALATLLLRLLGPLQGLSNVRVDVMTALVSFDRVFEVTDLPSMVQDKPGATDLPEGSGAVEFDHVGFRYPTADEASLPSLELLARPESSVNEDVLHGLSFRAEPGQVVALVGPSGAGKTTLTHLVARLYDVTDGAVRIGTGFGPGDRMVDVRDATLESVHRTVGYVTQDAHMFHDTIGENLRYARPDATDAELWEALEAAQIAPMVRSLSDGLDTVVGDRGYRLSGGERQRLAIARLLLKAPPVVVLDEATAHLDSESEHAVQQALSRALAGRTSLVIAHRLSTIRDADLILVVAGGRVAQQGTHEELLASGGLYADLYRTQFVDDVSAV